MTPLGDTYYSNKFWYLTILSKISEDSEDEMDEQTTHIVLFYIEKINMGLFMKKNFF